MRNLLSAAGKFPVLKLLLPAYVLLAAFFAWLIARGNVQLLNPAGYIAEQQSHILWGVIVFAIVVASIMISAFFVVVFRYREDKRAAYKPDWAAGRLLQIIGWGVPFLALSAISVMVWITAHQVDPYRPIASASKPITIQVVALRWKWLFIYPGDHIATVNTIEIPVGTPVTFQLTADAPMNSFWIPQLSGQIYAMTGMVTQLHIRADKAGEYAGGPAEISGDDFANMTFKVHAVSPSAYSAWKTTVRDPDISNVLSYASYQQLAKPSSFAKPQTYRLADSNLFNVIVMQFMVPTTTGGSA